ncbi:MAG: hypothetical protein MMC33_001265 [Icmadophila ericetorum]|nr:hypothetical protein [Icmadophila ericetorum]
MLSKFTFLLLAVAFASANGTRLAAVVPRDLSERVVQSGGGWSLSLGTDTTCPSTTFACGSSWCCPSTLACVHTGNEDIAEVCCPTDTDCSATFITTPICADSSWTLFNSTFDTTDGGGYFCCLEGEVGLQDGTCVSVAAARTAGPPAVTLAIGSEPPTTASTPSAIVSVSTTVISVTTESVSVVSSTSVIVSVSVSTAIEASAGTGSASVTSEPTTTPVVTSGGAGSASSPVATVTGKSDAATFDSLGGASLGGLVAAVFAFALL